MARGYPDGSYDPFNDVSCIQAVSFITRAMVNSGRWVPLTTDNAAIYPNVSLDSGHRLDLRTYVRNAGALPNRPTGQPWADWTAPASRGWFAQVPCQALTAP